MTTRDTRIVRGAGASFFLVCITLSGCVGGPGNDPPADHADGGASSDGGSFRDAGGYSDASGPDAFVPLVDAAIDAETDAETDAAPVDGDVDAAATDADVDASTLDDAALPDDASHGDPPTH